MSKKINKPKKEPKETFPRLHLCLRCKQTYTQMFSGHFHTKRDCEDTGYVLSLTEMDKKDIIEKEN